MNILFNLRAAPEQIEDFSSLQQTCVFPAGLAVSYYDRVRLLASSAKGFPSRLQQETRQLRSLALGDETRKTWQNTTSTSSKMTLKIIPEQIDYGIFLFITLDN